MKRVGFNLVIIYDPENRQMNSDIEFSDIIPSLGRNLSRCRGGNLHASSRGGPYLL